MVDLKFDKLKDTPKLELDRLCESPRVDVDRLWWIGAAVAGALLLAALPRLIPQADNDIAEPFPRSAEHAEV